MMIKLIIFIFSLILLILDNSIIPFFSIHGGYPSLLFTFAITYSLLKDKEDAVYIGTMSGIMQDIYFGNVFGINSLVNLFMCLLASFIGQRIVKNKKIVPVISLIGMTILKYLIIISLFYLIDIKFYFDIIKTLIAAIENGIIIFLIYNIVARIIDKNNGNQRWGFK